MTGAPRIVHVVSSLLTGGAELNTIRLLRRLADRGFDQVLVSLTNKVDPKLVEALPAALFYPRGRLRFLASARFLAGILREWPPGIIHGRGFVTWLDCVVARGLAAPEARVLQSFHGPATFEDARMWRKLVACGLVPSTAAFIAVSRDIADRLHRQWGVPRPGIAVISNGVDVGQFDVSRANGAARSALHIDVNAFVVGSVGVLRDVKNHHMLIEAFAGFHAKVPDSVLVLVGDGPLREALQEQARCLGVSHAVRFTGFEPCVKRFLHAMDVYVQSSLKEGSPTALLEAMACGVPAVAARSAGSVELNGSCGMPVLLDSNTPEVLARTLYALAVDSRKRSELSQRGRGIVVADYDHKRAVNEYEQLYRSVMPRDWTAATVWM